jgi:hypothetical protein
VPIRSRSKFALSFAADDGEGERILEYKRPVAKLVSGALHRRALRGSARPERFHSDNSLNSFAAVLAVPVAQG